MEFLAYISETQKLDLLPWIHRERLDPLERIVLALLNNDESDLQKAVHDLPENAFMIPNLQDLIKRYPLWNYVKPHLKFLFPEAPFLRWECLEPKQENGIYYQHEQTCFPKFCKIDCPCRIDLELSIMTITKESAPSKPTYLYTHSITTLRKIVSENSIHVRCIFFYDSPETEEQLSLEEHLPMLPIRTQYPVHFRIPIKRTLFHSRNAIQPASIHIWTTKEDEPTFVTWVNQLASEPVFRLSQYISEQMMKLTPTPKPGCISPPETKSALKIIPASDTKSASSLETNPKHTPQFETKDALKPVEIQDKTFQYVTVDGHYTLVTLPHFQPFLKQEQFMDALRKLSTILVHRTPIVDAVSLMGPCAGLTITQKLYEPSLAYLVHLGYLPVFSKQSKTNDTRPRTFAILALGYDSTKSRTLQQVRRRL
jgi:hypothetical protein